jgi:hypothetical protein
VFSSESKESQLFKLLGQSLRPEAVSVIWVRVTSAPVGSAKNIVVATKSYNASRHFWVTHILLYEQLPATTMQLLPRLRSLSVRGACSTTLQHHRPLSTSPQVNSITNPSSPSPNSSAAIRPSQNKGKEATKQESQKKTMAQLDEELRQKLEGMSGEGGAAGIELENGKPVAMKRGVRENMFRLI